MSWPSDKLLNIADHSFLLLCVAAIQMHVMCIQYSNSTFLRLMINTKSAVGL